jgi:arylsulfatase A-like enzyme
MGKSSQRMYPSPSPGQESDLNGEHKMSRLTVVFFVLLLCMCHEVPGADQPNVIVILTDDQGWGDLSLNGNVSIQTPHIDQLAGDGARFQHFYVSPVCSPTRAEFLTGRHHVRCGVYSTSEGGERVNADEIMIGEVFRNAGYRTGAFGKWHSGMQHPYHPNARGFDEFYGFCSGHWGNYFSPMLEHNGQLVQGDGYLADDLTNRAIRFIESEHKSPFFVYLPYNTPHSPMQVPDRWWDKFKNKEITQEHSKKKNEKINHTRAALAMCENIDWNVGRLRSKLKELNLEKDTIVVYFSDNGPNGSRWNDGLRGRKGSTDEGGVRSPLVMCWPGVIDAGTVVTQICSAMDLLPTLAELAGIEVVGTKPIDGLSIAPLLLNRKTAWPDRTLVHHWKDKVSVRTQGFRLDYEGQLYDMDKDPGQQVGLNDSQPGLAAALQDKADGFRQHMLSEYGKPFDRRPFVVGYEGARLTQVPARDGVGHGNIERSNRFPNDSFFENWTSVDDFISWECEVGASGIYRAEIFYSCPKEDVGSTVELVLGDSTLTGEITVPHDPPLTGMENDRFKRTESYVKDFRRMTLGEIQLEEGEGTLMLRAKKIPGDTVMDFRLLLLTRVDL